MKSFRDALSFLTVIRLYGEDFNAVRAMNSFAYAGLFIGCVLASISFFAGGLYLEPVLVLAAWVGLTGALHLDGLMDSADGLFSHRDREKKLEIMKDPRTGAMGVVAAVVLLIAKFQAVSHAEPLFLILVPAYARFGLVWSMKTMPYIRSNGTGKPFFESESSGWLFQIVPVAALSLFAGVSNAAVLACVFVLTVLLLRWWYSKQLGGVTGDLLGAQCEVTETVLLLFAGCL